MRDWVKKSEVMEKKCLEEIQSLFFASTCANISCHLLSHKSIHDLKKLREKKSVRGNQHHQKMHPSMTNAWPCDVMEEPLQNLYIKLKFLWKKKKTEKTTSRWRFMIYWISSVNLFISRRRSRFHPCIYTFAFLFIFYYYWTHIFMTFPLLSD